ncbi:RalGAP [Acrasis kona]|uniref:RalGAP n=1 Tax=Acrasis kona TaxID=1008807 RepID=A0AAW2YUW4_9EUKA
MHQIIALTILCLIVATSAEYTDLQLRRDMMYNQQGSPKEYSHSYMITDTNSIFLTSYDLSSISSNIKIVSASLYIASQDIDEKEHEAPTSNEHSLLQTLTTNIDSTVTISVSKYFDEKISSAKVQSGLVPITQQTIRKGETIAVDITQAVTSAIEAKLQELSLGFKIVDSRPVSFASREDDPRSSYIIVQYEKEKPKPSLHIRVVTSDLKN